MSIGKIQEAREFAIKAHGSQTYGDKPYEVHLDDVSHTIIKFCRTDESISAEQFELLLVCSLLHDVLEDTEATREELESRFGKEISDLIYCVSDEPGKNRKERKAKTYPKIASNNLAIALKLADRIANVENCRKNNTSLFSMYAKEHTEFRKQLFNGRFASMWLHLDNLMDPEYITK